MGKETLISDDSPMYFYHSHLSYFYGHSHSFTEDLSFFCLLSSPETEQGQPVGSEGDEAHPCYASMGLRDWKE